jgi:hypothetical protein
LKKEDRMSVKNRVTPTLVAVLAGMSFIIGCGSDYGFPGFKIKTTFTTAPSPTPRSVVSPDPFVVVSGQWMGDLGLGGPPTGSQFVIDPTFTDSQGRLDVPNGRIIAVWTFQRDGGHCGPLQFSFVVKDNQTNELPCDLRGIRFTASPDSIDANSPPATITLTGSSLTTQYGMPSVEYYDEYGTFIGQVGASSVADDGSWLQAATPGFYGVYSGAYTVVITNTDWDGSRNVVGTAIVSVYGNDPPPPDPLPDPCSPLGGGSQMVCYSAY